MVASREKKKEMASLKGDSTDRSVPAVSGVNTGGGAGVFGQASGNGDAIFGQAAKEGRGVVGVSAGHTAVEGNTKTGVAVWALADGPGGMGVYAKSETYEAVHAETNSSGTAAIAAYNLNTNATGAAIYAEHKGNSIGVLGKSNTGVGLWGVSDKHEGVHAETGSPVTAAIAGYNLNPEGTGAAIFGKKDGPNGHAGFFAGNVYVTGELGVAVDIRLTNADCAENFDIEGGEPVEPGTVVVLGREGAVRQCRQPYDNRVAGVVSGAGDFKPGIILDQRPESQTGRPDRAPIALLGKVFCRVDANYGPVEAGDLLTTSATPGFAMKVDDPVKAFGAVLGKAMGPLTTGRALIPVLITLQ